jgi:hypothetical protein
MKISKGLRSDLLTSTVLFIGVLLFLYLTYPENRTEADDAFWYAALVRDANIHSLYNPRFLLFLPLMKILHGLVPSMEVYDFMCFVSMIFAAGILVLLRITLKEFTDLNRSVIMWTLLLTLVSYEFWRYAFESEVYMLAIFLVLLTFYYHLKIFTYGISPLRLIILIAVSSFTVLVYKPAFLAVFVAFPVFFLIRKYYRQAIVLYGVSGIIVLAGYYLTYLVYTIRPDTFIAHALGGTNDPKGSALMAPIVVVSNFVATAWVFGVGELKSTVARVFSHKVMQEELLTASQVGDWSYVLIVLAVILGILFVVSLLFAVRHIRKNGLGWSAIYSVLLLMIIIYGGFLLFMDPSSNEPWLMLTIPLAILIAKCIIEPLVEQGKYIIPWAFILVFLVYNYIGGIGLLKDRNYDYNYLKSAWLNRNTESSDIIFSLGPMSFVRYLDYYAAAPAYNFEEQYRRRDLMLDTLDTFGNAIYLSADMMNPPRAISYRSGITMDKLDSVYRHYNYTVEAIDSTNGFKTYKLVKDEY